MSDDFFRNRNAEAGFATRAIRLGRRGAAFGGRI